MIYHYLKIAFRNLIKYKTQSIVSIVGLAIGFTCFALSVLWIRYEMTYDDFHEDQNASTWQAINLHCREMAFLIFHPVYWQIIWIRTARRWRKHVM